MYNAGDFLAGSTVRIPWNSNSAAGASITLATNGDIRVYKDSGTTERSSSAGITDGEDFDSVTGTHYTTLDLSDNTDAGFYAAGHDFVVMRHGMTIDGQTVHIFIGTFSIENRPVPARPLMVVMPPIKYNTATTVQPKPRVALAKAIGIGTHAVSADWTPATGDVKVSLDGGTEANIGTLPAFSNGAWELTLTGGETTAKEVAIRITDSVPKAVADAFFIFKTYGNASAQYPDDVSTAAVTPAVPGDAMTLTSPYDGIKYTTDGGKVINV